MPLKTLLSHFENKPLRMMVLTVAAIVVARLASEFGVGFAGGLITSFTDGI
ncbi:hypothetical protein [Caulobacter sp.]|uniref:hypothetical protein n=1 Tax=Caulobacter sp. TaxID=78 RepID=UPI001B0B01F4|nr:hypothetical protein [Caulobacter sp.]MBO9543501.1 hypothetical protein [Caulobacter sp.]